MATLKNTKGVWKADLYRFGYDLTVVGRTKEEAENAMREEYIKTYAKWNDFDEEMLRNALREPEKYEEYDPYSTEDNNEDYVNYNSNMFLNDYRMAFDDLDVRFYEFGKVEWE